MAARHRTYDAIAVLGFSAIHAVLPFPDQSVTDDVAAKKGGQRRDGDPGTQSGAAAAAQVPDILCPFFWSDVPELDEGLEYGLVEERLLSAEMAEQHRLGNACLGADLASAGGGHVAMLPPT